jgi:cytidyltransferase-like protein
MHKKIISYEKAKIIVDDLKSHNKKSIFKSGCFDIMHIGHIEMLKSVREYADIIIVGVGTDANITTYKRKPIFEEKNRLLFLSELECVDYVVLLDEPMIGTIDHEQFLTLVRPDYYHLPDNDKSLKEKKIMANKLNIEILVDIETSVSNFDSVNPHTTDILNIKLYHDKIEEIYKKEFDILKNEGNLVGDWYNVYQHCEMEANIATILARLMGLSQENTNTLIKAAILHDWYKRHERENLNYDSNFSSNGLKNLGYDDNIIEIAHSVGHTSFNNIMKKNTLCKAMHFIDDITLGSKIVEINERADATEKTGRYTRLVEEQKANFGGQSFFVIQKMIGARIQEELENICFLRKGSLVQLIKNRYNQL